MTIKREKFIWAENQKRKQKIENPNEEDASVLKEQRKIVKCINKKETQ